MLRPAIFFVVLLMGAAGCQGPSSSTNFFAPFGPSRVPPPPTGSIKPGGTYYQPSAAPPRGLSQAAPSGERAADLSPASLTQHNSQQGGGPTARVAQGQRSAKKDASSPRRDSLLDRLHGMPINDATKSSPPRPFRTPGNLVEISQLPPPKTSTTWNAGGGSVNRASYSVDDASHVDSSAWRSKSRSSDSGR